MKTTILCVFFTLMLALPTSASTFENDISSTAFIVVLGLQNADANITQYNIARGAWEVNPIAAPFMSDWKRYPFEAVTLGTYVLGRELLRDFDHQHHLEPFGTKDVETLIIGGIEIWAISTWSEWPANIKKEVLLSEAEFLITSSVLNIQF